MSSAEHRSSMAIKLLFRFGVNVGLVFFFQSFFPEFFVLQGGVKAIVFVGLLIGVINWMVVPLLHLLSLPIKMFAWIVGFFLVNAAALWLAREFVTALAVPGISLTIGGGIVGLATARALGETA